MEQIGSSPPAMIRVGVLIDPSQEVESKFRTPLARFTYDFSIRLQEDAQLSGLELVAH